MVFNINLRRCTCAGLKSRVPCGMVGFWAIAGKDIERCELKSPPPLKLWWMKRNWAAFRLLLTDTVSAAYEVFVFFDEKINANDKVNGEYKERNAIH